jgi:Family of unknown function (DUF6288)
LVDNVIIIFKINPIMKPKSFLSQSLTCALSLASLILVPSVSWSDAPDLKEDNVISGLKNTAVIDNVIRYVGHKKYAPGGVSFRSYDDTYNLGTTGMRGWIYAFNPKKDANYFGLATDLSRQILVTSVGKGSAAEIMGINKDDVILGVSWGDQPIVNFNSDARKAFGRAIVEAEKTDNKGKLNVNCWRAGRGETVAKLKLGVLGSYDADNPINNKTTLILDKARTQLLKELYKRKDFLTTGHSLFPANGYEFNGAGALNGLALLSVVGGFKLLANI